MPETFSLGIRGRYLDWILTLGETIRSVRRCGNIPATSRSWPTEVAERFRPPAVRRCGPTGNMFSRGWDQMADEADAFKRSFDPRIPLSIHTSHLDSTRINMPAPLAERCIEDWQTGADYGYPHEELDLGPSWRPARYGQPL